MRTGLLIVEPVLPFRFHPNSVLSCTQPLLYAVCHFRLKPNEQQEPGGQRPQMLPVEAHAAMRPATALQRLASRLGQIAPQQRPGLTPRVSYSHSEHLLERSYTCRGEPKQPHTPAAAAFPPAATDHLAA